MGGVGCTSQDASHTVTAFNFIQDEDQQGILPLGRPAGSGRDGKVVITPVFAQAATYPITELATPPEGGSVSCVPNPVPEGETSVCTAFPNPGCQLTGVSGCGGTATATNPFITGAVIAACTVTAVFQSSDGGGDDDGGNDGSNIVAVPTLSEWALLLLSVLAAVLGVRRLRGW